MQTRWYYIHDAQGNLMATYRYNVAAIPTESRFFLQEHPLYGSDRVGMDRTEIETTGLAGLQLMEHQAPPTTTDGHLNYELKDHLGNITTVVTGVLVALDGSDAGTDADLKIPQVVSYSGYDPFGSLLPGRNFSSSSYRFGFQGQEKDDEIHGATGTSLAFEYRMHDPRVGRFLSIDPLAAKYPFYSPYSFAGNHVIQFCELEGLEPGRNRGDNSGYTYTHRDGSVTQGVTESPNLIDHKARKAVPFGTPFHGAPLTGIHPGSVNFNDPNQIAVLKRSWEFAQDNQQVTLFEFNVAAGAVSAVGELGTAAALSRAASMRGAATLAEESILQVADATSVTPSPRYGDLTTTEVRAIQDVVDEAGRPLEVVGSAARGERRGLGTDLPLGKGPGKRSDIDYITPPGSLPYFNGLQPRLPSIDPKTGISPGAHNPWMGPGVRFSPGSSPTQLGPLPPP